MSLLNGSMPARCPDTIPEFIDAFIDGITDEEWAHLANMLRINTWGLLICVVVDLRKELAWPLADRNHPLNPAARYAA
jgi:hypothetical protein